MLIYWIDLNYVIIHFFKLFPRLNGSTQFLILKYFLKNRFSSKWKYIARFRISEFHFAEETYMLNFRKKKLLQLRLLFSSFSNQFRKSRKSLFNYLKVS